MTYLRETVDLQISWLNQTNKLLPDLFRVDSNQNSIHEFVTLYLTPGAVIYDVGGGKQSMIPFESQVELGMAGAYDATVCCDITKYQGTADGDVVICRALLEHVKRAILFWVFPKASKARGFRAYYDRCTSREIKSLAGKCGLLTERLRLYCHSNYFAFVTPLYALWRIWSLAFYMMDREQAAETFSVGLRKGFELARRFTVRPDYVLSTFLSR